jgi:hypothetical protein
MKIDCISELCKDASLEQIQQFYKDRMEKIKCNYKGQECGCGSFIPEDQSIGTHSCMDCKRKIL